MKSKDNVTIDCPCKRKNCMRHLKCDACRMYHYELKELPFCERNLKLNDK